MIRTAPLLAAFCLPLALLAQPQAGTISEDAAKARADLDAGRPYRALKRCAKAIDRTLPDVACYAPKAEALNRIGDPRAAIVDAWRGVRLHPPSAPQAYLQLGIAYYAIGMRDSAEMAYDKASGLTEMLYRRALLERETGRGPLAIQHLNEALANEPLTVRYRRERGVTSAMLGDSASARADLDSAIALDPKDPVSWNARGFHRYAAFGDHQRAIHDYNQAIKLDKNHGYAFNNRGWSRYKLGNTEGGLRDIRLAGRKNPSNAMVDRNLAMIALDQGNTNLACTHLRGAIDKQFTARFGGEVEELVVKHCGGNTSPAPKDMLDRNAPATPNVPVPKQRGNAP